MSICNGNGRYGTGGNENFSGTRNTVCSASCLSQVDRERLGSLIASVSSFPVAQTLVVPDLFSLATLDLSVNQWIQAAAPSGLFMDASANTSGGFARIPLGPDTAENAAKWQAFFGLEHVGDSVALRFPLTVVPPNLTVILLRAEGTSNVYCQTSGGAPAISTNITTGVSPLTSIVPLVQVTAVNVDDGSQVVSFNLLRQATP